MHTKQVFYRLHFDQRTNQPVRQPTEIKIENKNEKKFQFFLFLDFTLGGRTKRTLNANSILVIL